MEHAGRGLAEVVLDARRGRSGPVVLVCGPGQNGGDGLACARFLRSFEIPILVARLGSRPPIGDASIELAALSHEMNVAALGDPSDVEAFVSFAFVGASVVVDALYGVGLDRDLDAASMHAVLAMNATNAIRVAADLPSGLDADTGTPRPICVRADVTAAMGFVKRGCRTEAGAPWCGRLVEIDIGLPHAIHGPYREESPAN